MENSKYRKLYLGWKIVMDCVGHQWKNTVLKLFCVLSALPFPENSYVFSCLEVEEVHFIRISPESHFSLN